MHTLKPPYPSAEIARRGEALYAEKIGPLVEAEHHGDHLVMDIETGAYEFETREEPLAACDALRRRNPQAVMYRVRVGYRAATKMGGSWRQAER